MNLSIRAGFLLLFFLGATCLPTIIVAQEPEQEDFDLEWLDEKDRVPAKSAKAQRHEKLIEKFFLQLESEDERARVEAAINLKKAARRTDVLQLLEELKKGNSSEKQIAIIETLGILGDRRVAKRLRAEFKEGDFRTRLAVIEALGKLNFDWPVPFLTRVMTEDDQNIFFVHRAAAALGSIATNRAKYALRNSLDKVAKPAFREGAYWAYSRSRGAIDNRRIDKELPPGQKLPLFYKGTKYLFYHPTIRELNWSKKTRLKPRLLVCIHDIDYQIDDLFRSCWKWAKNHKMALLVPFFDNMRFPEYYSFNLKGERSDKRLLEIIEHVAPIAKIANREFYLYGTGWGGNFVQRFVMAYSNRVARAVFSGETFSMLEGRKLFPAGVLPTPLAPDLDLDVYNFVKSDVAMIYSKETEFQRMNAVRFVKQVNDYCEVNGITPRISMQLEATSGLRFNKRTEEFLFEERKF